MDSNLRKRSEYIKFFNELKERIRIAQTKAILSVNKELISLYWDIGKSIVKEQEEMGWGKRVVEQLARDLRREFQDVKGFSARNIWRMRAFYLSYTKDVKKLAQPVRDIDGVNLPQAVAEIPWGHNLTIINKIKDEKEREWYIYQTLQNGWSRNMVN